MKFIYLFIICLINIGNAQFPVAPLGDCYEGVHILGQMYVGHNIKYAYDPFISESGHVWCIVDGQPIDSYYGFMYDDYWMNPAFIYNSIEELDAGIEEQTGFEI